jgi:hypothetical protein
VFSRVKTFYLGRRSIILVRLTDVICMCYSYVYIQLFYTGPIAFSVIYFPKIFLTFLSVVPRTLGPCPDESEL